LARPAATEPPIADGIVAAALDFQRGDARDDIAVVVIKVPVA
jgi:hypothetical protein